VTALLHAELLKLRTTRTFVALATVAVGTSLLITGLVSLLTKPTEESVLVDVFASDTSSVFILVLAVVGITGEWRHRTITSSLLAAPNRLRFAAAKTLAFAAAGLALSVLISIAVCALGLAILSVRDLPTPDAGELAAQLARNATVAALLGALGVGIGTLVRNQVVAVVVIFVATFVVEPTVLALAPEVARFGPLVGLPTAASGIPPDDAGLGGDVRLLAPGLAALALLAWIAAAFAAGVALLRGRDVV
jgi:ABC-2 type transport system permease protein